MSFDTVRALVPLADFTEPVMGKLNQRLCGPGVLKLTARRSPVLLTNADTLSAVPAGAAYTVVLHEGPLTGGLAPALRRSPAAYVLACRENGTPSDWEMDLLIALMDGRRLRPTGAKAQAHLMRVGAPADLRKVADVAASVAMTSGGHAVAAQFAQDVMYELAANGLFDAPADATGQPKYAFRRTEDLTIDAEDACGAEVGRFGDKLYLWVADRFGRLQAEDLARPLESYGQRAGIDSTMGGARLGMRRILQGADCLAVRVLPGKLTEVMAVVDLGPSRRRQGEPKSIFFRMEG